MPMLCFSDFLWSISHPGKTGVPSQDIELSEDEEVCVKAKADLSPIQLLYERVLVKVFKHHDIPTELISDEIRAAAKTKLWRMGKLMSSLGGKKRQQQLMKWQTSTWNLQVHQPSLNNLVKRKRKLESELSEESTKRRRLETEIKTFQKTAKDQSQTIARLAAGRLKKSRGLSERLWSECSRQQQYNRKRRVARSIQGALSFCEGEGFKPCTIEIENIDTGNRQTLDVDSGSFSSKEGHSASNSLHSSLYVKDKYCISNQAYHELSMLSNLPASSQVNRLVQELNSQYKITSAPNGIVGVQQSLRERLKSRLTRLVEQYNKEKREFPDTIRVKLTGDSTQIARGLNVVNIAFTILEEGRQMACSASGNHSIMILKVAEKYEDLAAGLEKLIAEAKDLEVLSIDNKVIRIEFFLGGDWKFLALVCGLESATSDHACIWCKCPKKQRHDMDLTWSMLPEKGGRSVKEISDKSKLSKSSKNRFNCSHQPMFSFIPLCRVVIDSLHLFLRIADVLINLIIRDLRTLDGVERATSSRNSAGESVGQRFATYIKFLNDTCKIRFQCFTDKEKKLNWRDLTGPEKVRLFKNIDIPVLFPDLQSKDQLKKLWSNFFHLTEELGKVDCNAVEIERQAKEWIRLFTTIYQTKDVTPYMHALSMHVPEFIRLYGNIVVFTQQGLEKLNDITTVQFQRASNHRESEALKQLLQKRNRIEELEHYQRVKQVKTCSKCKQTGHNKRSCSLSAS